MISPFTFLANQACAMSIYIALVIVYSQSSGLKTCGVIEYSFSAADRLDGVKVTVVILPCLAQSGISWLDSRQTIAMPLIELFCPG